jgi:hypothetical protein
MVMSVAARAPRVRCIRCGQVAFHQFRQREGNASPDGIAGPSMQAVAQPQVVTIAEFAAVVLGTLSNVEGI